MFVYQQAHRCLSHSCLTAQQRLDRQSNWPVRSRGRQNRWSAGSKVRNSLLRYADTAHIVPWCYKKHCNLSKDKVYRHTCTVWFGYNDDLTVNIRCPPLRRPSFRGRPTSHHHSRPFRQLQSHPGQPHCRGLWTVRLLRYQLHGQRWDSG